jgi:hypothetical protein
MATPAAVNTIQSRITQLEQQRSQVATAYLTAEIKKDRATRQIDISIKEGKTQEASTISTQEQQPAQLEINQSLQQLVKINRDIAQLNVQVAKLTGQVPPGLAGELGDKATADLQSLLARDPVAFEKATIEILTGAAVRSADFLRQQGNSINFGDEVVSLVPPLPSDIISNLTPQGRVAIESLTQDAQQQYEQFIQQEATKAIPRYANSATPPPVTATTTLPGTTGGAALTRVRRATPEPQEVPGGRDIAIAAGLAIAGSAALAFINNRGNVVPLDTPQIGTLPVATPPIVPQQQAGTVDPQVPVNLTLPDQVDSSPVTSPQPVSFADDYGASDDAANLDAAAQAEAEAFQRGGTPPPVTGDPQAAPRGPAFDDDGNLQPGFTLDGDGNAIFVGDNFIDPSLTASAEASRAAARQQATLNNARNQAAIQSQRKQGNDTDWRFRISLAPQSTYLYNAPDAAGQPGSGILAPLKRTNGVIFPYTPRISTVYEAQYSDYQLTHSNYRGYFYQGSRVNDIQIEATFTAQDTAEAEYLLAVIHFFRSATKMFYGQDPERGTPPPLVYLRGFGEFQFNLHPCVISQFNYNLPNDVDYIRARSKNTAIGSLLQRRQRESLPTNVFTSAWQRLSSAGLTKGAQPAPPPVPSLGVANATYVPTKLDMTIVCKPIQSREEVSRQFSLKQYANGDLLKGGFW